MNLNTSTISATSGISNVSSIVERLDFSTEEIDTSIKAVAGENNDRISNIIKQVMKFYIRHNLTLVCLEDTVRLLNGCANLQLPTSKRSIINMFEENTPLKIDKIYYVKCIKCIIYEKIVRGVKNFCSRCQESLVRSETIFFVYFPVKNQIVDGIRNNWDSIQNFNANIFDHDVDFISDVQNASYITSLFKKKCPEETCYH